MNALYGNSFIDLAKYMKRPSSLSTRIISKFKNRNNEEEIKCRNHLISNFLKYATEDEINEKIKELESSNYKPNVLEKMILLLYSGNKPAAVELLTQNKQTNLAILISQSNHLRFSVSGILFISIFFLLKIRAYL